MIWSRQDEDERAVLKRNDALRMKLLGPEIYLDLCLEMVLGRYLDLRREAGSERGIKLPVPADPVLVHHLRALDDEFTKERAKGLEVLKNKSASNPRMPRRPTRRH